MHTAIQYLGTGNKAGLNGAIFIVTVYRWGLSEPYQSQGTAVVICDQFCGTLVVLVAGPIALNAISWKFYLILIVPPAIELVLMYLYFPEIKQHSSEVSMFTAIGRSCTNHILKI